MKRALVAVLFAGLLTSCQTNTQQSDGLEYPLNQITQAVEMGMTMGIQRYSENRREVYSRPFLVSQSDAAKKAGYRERGIAKVTVLGDRRPYTIETEVQIEKAKIHKHDQFGPYAFDRYDKRLANRLLKNILEILKRHGGEKNVIDDFKPF